MSTLLASVLAAGLFLLVPSGAAAQTGNAQNGKALWDSPATMCRNCHGTNGEGGFGPDLAGRHLTVAQFRHAVRQPWGVMPAFAASQISDQEIADFVAYFDGLPAVAKPAPWRFPAQPSAPPGQRLALATYGCAQCHGPTLNILRMNLGAVGADFEWVKGMVYDHVNLIAAHWKAIGEAPPLRARMGDYTPARVPESMLREIWMFARDLGYRPFIAGRVSPGAASASGVTYTLTVEAHGIPKRGLTAEDLTIALVVPAGTTVVSTTGNGYQGVRADAALKATAAVWQLAKIAPGEHQTYSLTLSRAGTAADNVRGAIRWTKPAVKTGPIDEVAIALAPLAGGATP